MKNKGWLLLLMFVLLSSFVCATANLTDGLVRSYTMNNESDNLTSYTLVPNSAPYLYNSTYCMHKGCYEYDGTDDRHEVAGTGLPSGDSDKCMSAWIMPIGSGSGYSVLYGDAAASEKGWGSQYNGSHFGLFTSYQSTNYGSIRSGKNSWAHWVGCWQGSDNRVLVWVNGTIAYNNTQAYNQNIQLTEFGAGGRIYENNNHFNSRVDEYYVWDRILTSEEVIILASDINASYYPFPSVYTPSNFSISAVDSFNGSSILVFNVTIDGVYYSTSNGTIITHLLDNDTSLYNFTIKSNESGGYYDKVYTSYSVSSNLIASLDKLFRFYNVSYSDYVSYGGVDYVRLLNYSINYTCPSVYAVQILRYVNGSFSGYVNGSCSNVTSTLVASYNHSVEGAYNISFVFNTSFLPGFNNYYSGNSSFVSDLVNPVAVVSLNLNGSGFTLNYINASLVCTDSVFDNLTYNLTLNGGNVLFGNFSSGSVKYNVSDGVDGSNVVVGVCSDLFGSGSDNESAVVYAKLLCLIDEKENALFDVSNISGAEVFFDDNSSSFDFKENGNVSCVNFTSVDNDKLRVELVYSADTIVRYVDVSLIADEDLRVCANKEGVTHYEQLITGSNNVPVVLMSVFSNCVVAADYIRFAYQDTLVLKAYTTNNMYYLYNFDGDGRQTFLASVDGSISTYINIDTLEFKQTAYNINILGDTLTFEKSDTNEILIYYRNLDEDNDELQLNITRLDTNVVVFSSSSFADPNEFTIYFNWAALNNVTNDTIFKFELFKTLDDGSEETLTKYYNINAKKGDFGSGFAFAIGFLMTIFGLTFLVSRSTFSWFGIIVMLISIGFLSFALAAWYVTFLMAIDVICMVYIVIILLSKNYGDVA